ncbi:MAG: YggS family pyridoxal phosphate-dependent enzyme [Pseudomonadota bacterium]
MATIPEGLQAVAERIRRAAEASGRAASAIKLLAVSKTFSADAVRAAYAAGQRTFGENYVQEALDKMGRLGDLDIEWHFIGPIQSNKTGAIARHFDWVHGIDREQIARRLSEARPATRGPLQVCVQVNVGGEASKSGVAPEAAASLARSVTSLPGLRLRGLMTIPRPSEDPAVLRAQFRRLRQLAEELRGAGLDLDTLSMGMSDDLETAIAEGATLVRVGTAIFGPRRRRPVQEPRANV